MDEKTDVNASSCGDSDEPNVCEICIEPLTEGLFTLFLCRFVVCDECLVEVSNQVLAVLQRRLGEHVLIGQDGKPQLIVNRDELGASSSGTHATVYPIRT